MAILDGKFLANELQNKLIRLKSCAFQNLSFENCMSFLGTFSPPKFDQNRLKIFLDPSKGDSFQSQKALDAIKQGGLKGQGMGEGVLKDNVPEAHTDYIIAIITANTGPETKLRHRARRANTIKIR